MKAVRGPSFAALSLILHIIAGGQGAFAQETGPEVGLDPSTGIFREDDLYHALGGVFAGGCGALLAFSLADGKDIAVAAASSALLSAFAAGLSKEIIIDMAIRGGSFDSRDLGWSLAGGTLAAWCAAGLSISGLRQDWSSLALGAVCLTTGTPVFTKLISQLRERPRNSSESGISGPEGP